MAYRGALLLLCASLAAGRAPIAVRRSHHPRPPKRRLRSLADGGGGAAEKPRVTWNNCTCLKEWNEPGLGNCSDYCCNPNGDAASWCMVKDEECEGEDWGFCKPTQPIRPGCHDSPLGWLDADQAPCSDYYVYQWCNSTGGTGAGWDAEWGPISDYGGHEGSATTACCACGGGSTSGDASAVPALCTDRPGWYDSDGDGCADYASMHWCNSSGGFGLGWHAEWGPFNGQPNASVACCACGGGSRAGPAGAAAGSTAAAGPTSAPAAPTAAATAAPGTTAPPAAAGAGAAKRFTWNGCLCRREWQGDMLAGSLLRGSCSSSCCGLGDPQGEWCVVEDRDCEDQQWGYCRPPSTGADSCTNSPSTWQDSQGNNCDAYQYMGWCTAQGGYGEEWEDEWGRFEDYAGSGGRAANTACCRCGGGERGAAAAAAGDMQCVDKADWHDNDGDTCREYAEHNWCTSEGGYGPGWHSEWGTFDYYSGQFTAAAACCACGGGSLAGAQAPAPPPAAGTPAPEAGGSMYGKGTMVGLAAAVLVGAGVGIYCFRAKAAAAGTSGGRNLQIGSTQLGRKYQSADGL